MDNYRLGQYKFNKRMTMVIGALVIMMALIMGGGLTQATYNISQPVESVVTVTGDLDTADQVIADELIDVTATISEYYYNIYAQGSYQPSMRLISETGTISASSAMIVERTMNGDTISGSFDVTNLLEGTYTLQIVFITTNAGEISDEISGIMIDHPEAPGVSASLTISGMNPRVDTVSIEVTASNAPTYWTSRILIKDSVETELVTDWADATGSQHIYYFDTLAYVNGVYTVIGEIYEQDGQGDVTLIATTSETITTSNANPPTNELVANIYVRTASGTYSSWPVAKDGTGVLYGIVLVEGVVIGETPIGVSFIVELDGLQISHIQMSDATATGNWEVEFDTTTLADGNYDMFVEANFADGTSIKMSAWGFGTVPGTGADSSGFIIAGLAAVVIVVFIYGLKKREMLYT